MGGINEQIRQRIKADNSAFSYSLKNMTSALLDGRVRLSRCYSDNATNAHFAINAVLRYYHITPGMLPDSLTDLAEQLDYLLRPTGYMWRDVELKPGWWHDASGAMLATKNDGTPVALIPSMTLGYTMYDPTQEKNIPITKSTAAELETSAICLYQALPQKALKVRDLFTFMAGVLNKLDYSMLIVSAAMVSLIGLIPPYANRVLFSKVVNVDAGYLIPALIMLLSASISAGAIAMVRKLVLERLNIKLGVAMESAFMMRVLSLPASFFEKYNSGELSSRIGNIKALTSDIADLLLNCGLTSIFSLVYIGQIFSFTPTLGWTALLVLVLTLGTSILSTVHQIKNMRKVQDARMKLSGLVLSLFSGVQKLRLAGAERRGFAKWANENAEMIKLKYNPPFFVRFAPLISSLVSLTGTMLLYIAAVKGNVSAGSYMAFSVSYGLIMGAVLSVASATTRYSGIKPALELITPILSAVPEIGESKESVDELTGDIDMNSICFHYETQSRNVLEDFSLHISAGQYIAIVGQTGCGKSTLLKLLLGFEKPQKGAVYYNGKDVANLDLRSLRRHMGVVLQDSHLFSGNIFSNIAVSSPHLTMNEAWEAAEIAGLADDIRKMPMGMFTMISEGSGGVSGGQRQRIMIARAIASKPKILMLDEATSSLDNVTQRKVAQALGKLNCTRIVIAHRLSTIRQCDRIIVMENGRIVEDGSYDELIALNGCFADLVAHQRLDTSISS